MRKFYLLPSMFRNKKIFFIILSIMIGFLLLFQWFNRNVSSKLIYIAQKNLDKYVDDVASDFQIFLDESQEYQEFLEVVLNDQGEIQSVDYQMEKIYSLASQLTEYIQNSLKKSSQQQTIPYSNRDFLSDSEDTLILEMPLGLVTDSPFLVNLGPKIPVTYLCVSISYEVLLPVTKEEHQKNYELLIDSKLIQGQVPEWYNKAFESQSAFFELPFK